MRRGMPAPLDQTMPQGGDGGESAAAAVGMGATEVMPHPANATANANANTNIKAGFSVSPRSLAATSVASGSLGSSLGEAASALGGSSPSASSATTSGGSNGNVTWSGLSQLLRRGSNASSASPRSFDVDCLPTIMSPDHMQTPRRKTPQIDLGAAASSSATSSSAATRIMHVPCSFCGFLFVSAANAHPASSSSSAAAAAAAADVDAKFCSTVCREMMVWRQPHMHQAFPSQAPLPTAQAHAQAYPPFPTAGGHA